MQIGIDKIGYYVPNYYLDLKCLAKKTNTDYDKYKIGLMQEKMSIIPNFEDIITMGANCCINNFSKSDLKDIKMIIFATESGIDYSKSSATNILGILELSNDVRCIEVKQACYGLTFGLMMAYNHVLVNENDKVLVISSDISKYGFNVNAEATQGAGSCAMIISKNPRVLELVNNSAYYSEDILDFYRPDNSEYPIVDGKYSNTKYLEFFEKTCDSFLSKNKVSLNDFKGFAFHVPYSKIGLKALDLIKEKVNYSAISLYETSIMYNKNVGNIYNGSLYLNLIGLLDSNSLKENDLIGLYSYGSGATAEFFSLKIVKDYNKHINTKYNQKIIDKRIKLSYKDYFSLYSNQLKLDNNCEYTKVIYIEKEGKRIYERVEENV